MKLKIAFSLFLSLVACASNSKNWFIAEHRAGLKAKVWYKSVDNLLHDLKDQGKSSQDIEVEKQMLPKGGYVYLDRSHEVDGGPGLVGSGVDVLKMGDVAAVYFQININGEIYYVGNEIDWEKQPQNIFEKILSSPTSYGICKIEKSIDTTFDIIFMNSSKMPIGKYKIKFEQNKI